MAVVAGYAVSYGFSSTWTNHQVSDPVMFRTSTEFPTLAHQIRQVNALP